MDNEYLDKYCQLIIQNKNRVRQKYITQCHHIVPRKYFNYNNLPVDNSAENKVNLMYSDHLLAHYYLALCASTDWFKFSNINMLSCGAARSMWDLSDESQKEFLASLEHYQELYEYSKRYKSQDIEAQKKRTANVNKWRANLTEEQKREIGRKISVTLKSKNIHRSPASDTTRKKLRDANLGRVKSVETRKKISTSRLQDPYRTIHKGNEEKCVRTSKLNDYICDGWVKGALKKYVTVTNEKENLRIPKDQLNEYLAKGYRKGHNHKTSQKLKGCIMVTKDNKEKLIPAEDLDLYLAKGYVRGRSDKAKKALLSSQSRVYQITPDKQIVNKFDSIKTASDYIIANLGVIKYPYDVRRVCENKTMIKGFFWCFEEDYQNFQIDLRWDLNTKVPRYKPLVDYICQIDTISLKIIDTFISANRAANVVGNVPLSGILLCCNQKRKTSGGYYWCYLKDYDRLYGSKLNNKETD